MSIVGIAGPSLSGKTTLAQYIKNRSSEFARPIIVSDDLKDVAWENLVKEARYFTAYEEVYNDKDYLLIYCGRLLSLYESVIEGYRMTNPDDLVILDYTYLDYLVYMYLHFWFHYPSQELLTTSVMKAYSLQNSLDHIYVVLPDDETYPPDKLSITRRQSNTDFRRNRQLEIVTYDLLTRSNQRDVTILGRTTEESFEILQKDIMSRFGGVE